MTQYLISVWHDDEYELDFSGDDMARIGAQVNAFNEELTGAGALVFAGGMHPASTAKVVQVTDGRATTSDGAYAGTTRQMGGFWIVEAPDADTAMEWARKGAAACEQPVELRAFHDEAPE